LLKAARIAEARAFPHSAWAHLADHHLTLLRREDAPS